MADKRVWYPGRHVTSGLRGRCHKCRKRIRTGGNERTETNHAGGFSGAGVTGAAGAWTTTGIGPGL